MNTYSSIEIPLQEYSENSSTFFEPDTNKHLSHAAIKTHVTSKRKTVESEPAEDSDLYKKPCLPLNSSTLYEDLLQAEALQEGAMRSRLLQEEEDRRMAQQLQKELDREHAVNRRKGSSNEYLLRQKSNLPSTSSTSSGDKDKNSKAVIVAAAESSGQKVEGQTIARRIQGESGKSLRKSLVSKQAPPFSPPSQTKGTKQTTLTDMFPNLGN